MIRGYARHDAYIVSYTTMIIGHAQNGYIERVFELFEKMPFQDTISWISMIPRYAQNGFSVKAIDTLKICIVRIPSKDAFKK